MKIQRRLFRETGRELDRTDYEKLIAAALDLGRERIALVMETICATGIRVGEVRYITVEAVRAGSATISLSDIHILPDHRIYIKNTDSPVRTRVF